MLNPYYVKRDKENIESVKNILGKIDLIYCKLIYCWLIIEHDCEIGRLGIFTKESILEEILGQKSPIDSIIKIFNYNNRDRIIIFLDLYKSLSNEEAIKKQIDDTDIFKNKLIYRGIKNPIDHNFIIFEEDIINKTYKDYTNFAYFGVIFIPKDIFYTEFIQIFSIRNTLKNIDEDRLNRLIDFEDMDHDNKNKIFNIIKNEIEYFKKNLKYYKINETLYKIVNNISQYIDLTTKLNHDEEEILYMYDELISESIVHSEDKILFQVKELLKFDSKQVEALIIDFMYGIIDEAHCEHLINKFKSNKNYVYKYFFEFGKKIYPDISKYEFINEIINITKPLLFKSLTGDTINMETTTYELKNNIIDKKMIFFIKHLQQGDISYIMFSLVKKNMKNDIVEDVEDNNPWDLLDETKTKIIIYI